MVFQSCKHFMNYLEVLQYLGLNCLCSHKKSFAGFAELYQDCSDSTPTETQRKHGGATP